MQAAEVGRGRLQQGKLGVLVYGGQATGGGAEVGLRRGREAREREADREFEVEGVDFCV